MKISKLFVLFFTFVIGLTFLLTGCETGGGVVTPSNIVKTDKYKNGYKFEPPVTVTTFRAYGPNVTFLEGETIDKNVWTQAYEDYCGIKLKSIFSVTDYTKFDLKVTTSIATDSLPDLIPVYTTLFFRVADSGRVKDLKPYYDKYLDPELKTYMEKEYGGVAYKTAFRNNILASLSAPPDRVPAMQWIRQDWLDRYGLAWPKNINESIKIMKFFCQKNAGAPLASSTFAFPLTTQMDYGFSSAFGAYGGIWIDDGNGGIMRGDISEKWKPVLQILQDFYAAGYIDNDFTLTNSSTLDTQYTNQQFGFNFGGSSAPDGGLYRTLDLNPNAVWKQGLITDEGGNPALVQVGTRVGGFNCVNKKSQYPEALMFLANVYGDLMNGIGKEFQKYHDIMGPDKGIYSTFFYPLIAMSYPPVDFSGDIQYAETTKDLSKLTGEEYGIIGYFKMWTENKDPKGWRIWSIYKPDGSLKTSNDIINSNYMYADRGWGPETQAWIDKGPDLANINKQMFVKIIRGDLTVDDGFNQWLTYFNNNGGKTATDEINVWWQKEGKAAFPAISVRLAK